MEGGKRIGIEVGGEPRGVVDQNNKDSPTGVGWGKHGGGGRRCAWLGGAWRGKASAVKMEVTSGYAGKGVTAVAIAAKRFVKGLRLPLREDKSAKKRVRRVGGGSNCMADRAEQVWSLILGVG